MQIAKFFLLALAICMSQGQDEEICPPGADDWPHRECIYFYQCNNGQPILVECPDNLYWNTNVHSCDFPMNVPECVDGTRAPTGTTTPVTTTTVETTTPPTSTPPTTTAPTTTPPTTTTQEETPETEGPPPTTAQTTTTTTEETPETERTGTTPGVTTTTRLPPGVCPESGIHKIAHPEFCEAYYLCVNGVRQEPYNTCPEGLYFDVTIEECNLASDVECELGTIPPTTTTQAPSRECPSEGLYYLPYPGNCTLYIVCVDGAETFYRCPEGTLFDTGKLVCESESTAVCTVEFFFRPISNLKVKIEDHSIDTKNNHKVVGVPSDDKIFTNGLKKIRSAIQ